VLRAGAAQSRMADRWLVNKPGLHAGHLWHKDLTLALEVAAELGIDLPGAAWLRERIEALVADPPGQS